MYKYLLFVNDFSPKKDLVESLKESFNLTLDFTNKRTTLLSNDNFSISIDKNISRIQIFDEKDYDSIKKIREHFNHRHRREDNI